jgi:hypoxanthine phosphoribosyltransferase
MKVEKIVTEEELKTSIKNIAEELKKKIDSEEITLIGILRGGILFVNELARAITELGFNPEIEYIVVKKDEKKNINIVDFPPKESIENKVIIVTDDLIKSGETIVKVMSEIKRNNPAQLLSATLVLKEGAFFTPDAFGFSSEDTSYWVGYGMDYKGKYRNLQYLGEVKKEN